MGNNILVQAGVGVAILAALALAGLSGLLWLGW